MAKIVGTYYSRAGLVKYSWYSGGMVAAAKAGRICRCICNQQ